MLEVKKFFTDKEFYTKLFIIGLPVIIQQLLLTTFGIVDTLMVKSIYRGIGGVGLANQMSMIAGTIAFGLNVGVGLFIAQFFGDKDEENMKRSFALMTLLCFLIATLFTVVGFFFGEDILYLFNQDPEILATGHAYLMIVVFSYIPNLLAFSFSIAYRNIQKTFVPLLVSIVSSIFNITFNYLLIFGIGFFPEMGIRGAALATVISSFVAFFAHIIYAKSTNQIFLPKIKHYYEALERKFFSEILQKATPLVFNETLFAIGTALYVVIFNKFGTDSFEGYRIAESVVSIMLVIAMALGTSVSSMVGEKLGARQIDKAKTYAQRFLFIGLVVALFLGTFTSIFATPLVNLFKSDENTVSIDVAISLMAVFGLRVALRVFVVILFSIFRAGGMSRFVMIIDAGVMWLVGLPLAFIGYRYLGITSLPLLFLIIQIEPLARILIGFREFLRYRWASNLTRRLQ